MQVQNNIIMNTNECMKLNSKYDNTSEIRLFGSKKHANPITDIDNITQKQNKKSSKELKLPVEKLKIQFPKWQVKSDYIKTMLIGGGSAGLLFAILCPEFMLMAMLGGVLLGAIMTSGSYLIDIYKNKRDINNLQKYYNQLNDEQKQLINKMIEEGYYYPTKALSCIKKCKELLKINNSNAIR